MKTCTDIIGGIQDGSLRDALRNGYDAIITEGAFGKLLSIGSLVLGTIFGGCASTVPQPAGAHTLQIDASTPVTDDSVRELANEIADGIRDDMQTGDEVESTPSWSAAKQVYQTLVDEGKQSLADMFARTINRHKNEFFNAPDCCDDREYDNNPLSNPSQPHMVYNGETDSWEAVQ